MRGRGFTKQLARWAKRGAAELDAAWMALVADAQAAGRLRAYQRDPGVAALGVERSRDRLDNVGWLLVVLGLAFTTANVHDFIAMDAAVLSLRWVVAWFIEPMVMGMLLILLRGEQIANRHGEQADSWVRSTRWVLLLITYVMNTNAAWVATAWATVFIDSAVVLVVFLAAEALSKQRQTLTRVADKVADGVAIQGPAEVVVEPVQPVVELPQEPVNEPQDTPQDEETPGVAQTGSDDLSGARSFKERAYLAYAAFRREGIEPTPRQVDRRAEVRDGTTKVTGRMAEFAKRYEEEVSDGAHDADPAATG